jgi:filamentous hemagglutinin
LKSAQEILNADAGKPIIMPNGQIQLGSDGKPQTYFSATDAQKADPYGNIFPGGSPSTTVSGIPGKVQRDLERLERLTAINGSTTPDTTIEELLIGARIPGKTAGSVVKVTNTTERTALIGSSKSAQDALLASGGALDKAGQPLLDMKYLSNAQKERMGDLFGADTVKQIVPDGQKISRSQGVGTTGIDDLYKVNRTDVDYVVVEYKFVGQDGKTGAQVLSTPADGKQGSNGWISGSGRIEKAVGDTNAPAVYDAIRSGRFESWVVTTRPDGSTFTQVLDAAGRPKPIDTSKIILPNRNISGARP